MKIFVVLLLLAATPITASATSRTLWGAPADSLRVGLKQLGFPMSDKVIVASHVACYDSFVDPWSDFSCSAKDETSGQTKELSSRDDNGNDPRLELMAALRDLGYLTDSRGHTYSYVVQKIECSTAQGNYCIVTE